ncbi:hypothetical protein CRYUN_Cryun01aG0175600 [Craigia yunnanensis]
MVKKTLQKIHGVHSINIDADEGKVAVSSTVDPHLFIAMLVRAGQKTELLLEPAKPQAMNNLNQVEHQGKKMQFTLCNANGVECGNKKSQLDDN